MTCRTCTAENSNTHLVELGVNLALRLTHVIASVERVRADSGARQLQLGETDLATDVVVAGRATVALDELAGFGLVVVGRVLRLLDLRVEVRVGRTWRAGDN